MSTASTSAHTAAPVGPVRSALLLARDALACDWVAITQQGQGDASLKVVDSVSEAGLLDLELTGLVLPSAQGGFVDLGRGRISSAWTLACGQRPALGWIGPVPDSRWILLAAWVAPQPDPERLQALLEHLRTVLFGLFHGGGRSRAEQAAGDRVAELIRHIDLPVVFLDDTRSMAMLNPAAQALLALPQATPAVAPVAAALRQIITGSPSAGGHPAGDLFADAPQALLIDGRHWEMRTRRIDSLVLSGWLWLFNDTTAVTGQQRLVMEGLRAEAMARIIGGVAHQFNNLLTVVLGGADMVSLDPSLPPALRQTLEQVVEAADRGAAIVAQLRAFGLRGQPGRGQRAIALALSLEAIWPMLEGLVADQAQLVLEPVDPELHGDADPELFAEVMVNLVLNARESMVQAGEIVVSAQAALLSPQQAGALDLQFRDAVRIRVRDSGVGMGPAVQARAFEPFFTTRGMASARGLGLSVVEGWARGAGGCARIESTEGVGTVIELMLPRHRCGSDSAAQAAPADRRGTEPA